MAGPGNLNFRKQTMVARFLRRAAADRHLLFGILCENQSEKLALQCQFDFASTQVTTS